MHPSETGPHGPRDALRPEIALSWRRSRISGLTPAAPRLSVEPDAVDRRSRLTAAADPVLADLAEQLGDAGYCLVLADRESRIAEISSGTRTLRDRLAGLGGVKGGLFLEETTGTNSIATAHELHRGIAVHGEEHYLETFKQFSCYGHPIIHPVTHRLEGVLDITCLTKEDSPLLAPFLARAARDIEERLLHNARRAEQRMLTAFQTAAAGRNRPVLVLGEGVVLANPAAVELLDPTDHFRLRALADGLGRRGSRAEFVHDVELASGRTVSVRCHATSPGSDGVLFEFGDTADNADQVLGTGSPRRASAAAVPSARLSPGSPVYVGGAPGTGRTTAVLSLRGDSREALPGESAVRTVTLDASDATARGAAAWLAALDLAADGLAADDTPGLLLVEDVHLLPDSCSVRLHRLMRRTDLRIALTGPPLAELTGYAAALAADCRAHVELPRLRDRTGEIPGLVRGMLGHLGVADRLRLTPAALAVLAGHPWPGNLRELRSIVDAVARRRSAGDITPRDLPDGYQVSPLPRRMTPLERAEHDTISAALRECKGNKLRAAQRLGISRTTLYNRMRALRISG